MDEGYQIALDELESLKEWGLLAKEVDLEAILKSAISSRVAYFKQAAAEKRFRRARWMLLTGVVPATLGRNFYETNYPPLQMTDFYKDTSKYFVPLVDRLGLKFRLVDPEYLPDGTLQMKVQWDGGEEEFAEKDPATAYVRMVGMINASRFMEKGTYLYNLAPFSGRGFLILLKGISHEQIASLERALVWDHYFSFGSWSRVFIEAQGMDEVDWGYSFIEIENASNGLFYNREKKMVDLVYPNEELMKKVEKVLGETPQDQMPKDYFQRYLVEKLGEVAGGARLAK